MNTPPKEKESIVSGLDPNIRKVMVAVDDSPASRAAIRYAAFLARQSAARVILAHVFVADVPTPAVSLGVAEDSIGKKTARQKRELAANTDVLDGIDHEQFSVAGPLGEAMRRSILKNSIDLLVLGSSGRTGFERLLHGSAAEEILRAVTCPVITIGPHAATRVRRLSTIQRVLVATDFGAASILAVGYAIRLTAKWSPVFTLLHVKKANEDRKTSVERARRNETELRQMFPNEAYEHSMRGVEIMLKTGEPAQQIIVSAKRMSADLIVLGARSSGPLHSISSHAKTAISARVIAEAECPVLTLHRNPHKVVIGN